ncbi:hypothetical protein N8922_02700 [Candidatus Pelagibacter sp.]|jgi:hypothetical protein|nr:hypothetical protein [Candidatus Pelagibacter sp.]
MNLFVTPDLSVSKYLFKREIYRIYCNKNEYHHLPGIFSYKMDYRKLFDWHPNCNCFSHEVRNYELDSLTDNQNNWVATSIIKKSLDE